MTISDDPEIDYMWIFISLYVGSSNRGPKETTFLFPRVGQFFSRHVEDAALVVSLKNFEEM